MSTPILGIWIRPSSITGSAACESAGGATGSDSCGASVVVVVDVVVDVVVEVVVVDVVVVEVVVGGSVVVVVEVVDVVVVVEPAVVGSASTTASAPREHDESASAPTSARAAAERVDRTLTGFIMTANHRQLRSIP
jgi:hypothetical protein